jgi:hypothetical protein
MTEISSYEGCLEWAYSGLYPSCQPHICPSALILWHYSRDCPSRSGHAGSDRVSYGQQPAPVGLGITEPRGSILAPSVVPAAACHVSCSSRPLGRS